MIKKDITYVEESRNNVDSTRRSFLKTGMTGAGLLAATASVGGLSLFESSGKPTGSTDSSVPDKWDADFDVVVVGSGFSGLLTAIEAKRAGASVIVLEKMPTFGGNSVINGGYMAVPNSDLQKEQRINDSVDLFIGLRRYYRERAESAGVHGTD